MYSESVWHILRSNLTRTSHKRTFVGIPNSHMLVRNSNSERLFGSDAMVRAVRVSVALVRCLSFSRSVVFHM